MAAGQAQLITTQVQLLRTLQATTGELETAITQRVAQYPRAKLLSGSPESAPSTWPSCWPRSVRSLTGPPTPSRPPLSRPGFRGALLITRSSFQPLWPGRRRRCRPGRWSRWLRVAPGDLEGGPGGGARDIDGGVVPYRALGGGQPADATAVQLHPLPWVVRVQGAVRAAAQDVPVVAGRRSRTPAHTAWRAWTGRGGTHPPHPVGRQQDPTHLGWQARRRSGPARTQR
jgi:hypothetical protein